MSDYIKIPTSAEVWAVIRARHPEMGVFASYSAPDGRSDGDPHQGVMQTAYGFPQCEFPLIEARTTWDIAPESPSYKRLNEKTEYWLCVGKPS